MIIEGSHSGPASFSLPREIHYMIIDSAQEDERTLRNCHAVCRSWSAAARKHLFQTLVLDSDEQGGPSRIEAASIILRHSNSVAPYIKRFKMSVIITDAALIRKVIELLPILSSVTTLWVFIDFDDAPEDLKDLFTLFLHHIKELTILCSRNSFREICEIVSLAPCLKTFMLEGSGSRKLNIDRYLFTPPNIQVFGGEYNQKLLALFKWLCLASPPAIHTMRLRLSYLQHEDMADISSALGVLGRTLRELHLTIVSISVSMSPLSAINLSRNYTLRKITIAPNRRYPLELHTWLIATLSTLPISSSPFIQDLHLFGGYLRPCTQSDLMFLAQIAPLVSQSSPALQKARLQYTLPKDDDIEKLEGLLQECAPELHSAGRVRLSLPEPQMRWR